MDDPNHIGVVATYCIFMKKKNSVVSPPDAQRNMTSLPFVSFLLLFLFLLFFHMFPALYKSPSFIFLFEFSPLILILISSCSSSAALASFSILVSPAL